MDIHFPALRVGFAVLARFVNRKLSYPISVFSMAGATWARETLRQAMSSSEHEVSYLLGGWTFDLFPRGVGIEFRADLWPPLFV